MKTLYFKPTRRLHESGFRMIEYGYCDIDSKCNAINIKKVGEYDVFMDRAMSFFHFDVTRNGYFRILEPQDVEWCKFFSMRLTQRKDGSSDS